MQTPPQARRLSSFGCQASFRPAAGRSGAVNQKAADAE